MKFILFCAILDLSDNRTEMRIVKNSIIFPLPSDVAVILMIPVQLLQEVFVW